MRAADGSPTPWLTLSEAAAYASVHIATLRREIRAGRLTAFRLGQRKAIRLKHHHIDAWIEGVNTPVPIQPGGGR